MRVFRTLFIFILLVSVGCSSNKLNKSDRVEIDQDFFKNLVNKNFELSENYLNKIEKNYEEMDTSQKCDFHFYKGCFLMTKELYDEGEIELNRCLDLNPNYVQALYTRANYYHRVKNKLHLAISDLDVIYSVLELLIESNKHIDNYENYLVQLYVLHPAPSDEYIAKNKGAYLKTETNCTYLSSTISYFRRAVLRSLERIADESESYEQAINYREKIIQFYEPSPISYHILGNYYYKMDDFAKAVELYEKAVPKSGLESEININIGFCYFQLKQYKDALLNFNRAVTYGGRIANINLDKIAIRKKNEPIPLTINKNQEKLDFLCNALFYKARSLEELDYVEEALDTMNKVIALDKRYTLAYYYRGYYYNGLKKSDLAVQDFKRALELDPSLTQLYYSIAVNYEHIDQPSSAKKYYQLYLAKDMNTSSKKHVTARERLEEL